MSRKRSARGSVGGEVRPTTQRILESLSATLRPRLEGARVLDLFAGTGQVGLEMAELGAERVVFVEGHRRVAQALRKRLAESEHGGRCELVVGAIPSVLGRIEGHFELILCDPPYDWEAPESLLPAAADLAVPGGLLVVEHHHKTSYPPVSGWDIYCCQKFGETRLSYFEREGSERGRVIN